MAGVILCPDKPGIKRFETPSSPEYQIYLNVCNQFARKESISKVLGGAGLTMEAFIQLYNKYTLLPHAMAAVPESAVSAVYNGMKEKAVGTGYDADSKFRKLIYNNFLQFGTDATSAEVAEQRVREMIREGLAHKYLGANGYSISALRDSKAAKVIHGAVIAGSTEVKGFFNMLSFGDSITQDFMMGDGKKGKANPGARFKELLSKLEIQASEIVKDPKIMEGSAEFAKSLSSRLSETATGRMLGLLSTRLASASGTMAVRTGSTALRLGAVGLLALGPIGDVALLFTASISDTGCPSHPRTSDIAEFDSNNRCKAKPVMSMKTIWGLANSESTAKKLSDDPQVCRAYLEMYKGYVLQIPGDEEQSKISCKKGNVMTWKTIGISGISYNENATDGANIKYLITNGGKSARWVNNYNPSYADGQLAHELYAYCNGQPSLLKYTPGASASGVASPAGTAK